MEGFSNLVSEIADKEERIRFYVSQAILEHFNISSDQYWLSHQVALEEREDGSHDENSATFIRLN